MVKTLSHLFAFFLSSLVWPFLHPSVRSVRTNQCLHSVSCFYSGIKKGGGRRKSSPYYHDIPGDLAVTLKHLCYFSPSHIYAKPRQSASQTIFVAFIVFCQIHLLFCFVLFIWQILFCWLFSYLYCLHRKEICKNQSWKKSETWTGGNSVVRSLVKLTFRNHKLQCQFIRCKS